MAKLGGFAPKSERLEKENAELRAKIEDINSKWLPAHDKLAALAESQSLEIEQLRAKLNEAYERAAELAYAYALDNGLRDHARRLENEILDLKEKP